MPKKEGCRTKRDSHGKTGNHKNSREIYRKEVDTMKGLEIAVIIIGCGIKILEVLEES